MKIIVTVEQKYGTERIMPADRNAEIFAQMLGQKSLTRENIAKIRELGYAVEVVAAQVTL